MDLSNVFKTVRLPGVDKITCPRHEAVVGIFSIDSRLKRPPAQLELFLGHRQFLSGGGSELPLDQVGVGDHLGHRVLNLVKDRVKLQSHVEAHLQPGVHLHEVEVEIFVHDKLHGAGTNIVHSPGGTNCSLT